MQMVDWQPRRAMVRRVGLAAVAVLMAAGAGCNRNGAGTAAMAMPPGTAVQATAVTVRDVPLYLDEIGTTAANNAVTLAPQVAGPITEVHFADGADVKKGQLLFVIDRRPFQAAYDQAQASLKASQATLAYAKQDLSFYQGLSGTNAVSAETFAQKQNTVAVDDANVAQAQAAVESAKVNLDYCTINSPLDGRAGRRLVDPGNVVQANTGQLVSIQSLDPIYAYFTITENELSRVREYVSQGTLECRVHLPADTGEAAAAQPAVNTPTTEPMSQPLSEAELALGGRAGQLTFLDNAVQDGSGTVKLRATIPNADRHFWPGQFVNVRLILTTQKDAVLIPSDASQVSQQGLFVYKVTPNDQSPTHFTAMQQPVALGQRHGGLIAVTSGLVAGDQVVTAGQMMLQPGAPIMVVPGSPPAGGGAAPAKVPASQPVSPKPEDQPKPAGSAASSSASNANLSDGRPS